MPGVRHRRETEPIIDDRAIFRSLVTIRTVEERLARIVLDRTDPLLGETALHIAPGQEGVAVGIGMARTRGDLLFSTHRGIAHCIAWGAKLFPLVSEIMGRSGGYGRGRGGHMHVIALEDDIAGTTGIVGGGLTLAVGAAWALQSQDRENVSVAFMGDGAANTGAFHEAMNLASVWKAPVIFVCENNGYAEMTKSSTVTSADRLSDRAASYGMAAEFADGRDVRAVLEVARKAFSYVREGNGPFFIECEVVRAGGHWLGDPQHYRDPRELDGFRTGADDPINSFLRSTSLGDAAHRDIADQVARDIDQLFEEVLRSPILDDEMVLKHDDPVESRP